MTSVSLQYSFANLCELCAVFDKIEFGRVADSTWKDEAE